MFTDKTKRAIASKLDYLGSDGDRFKVGEWAEMVIERLEGDAAIEMDGLLKKHGYPKVKKAVVPIIKANL